jgi:Ca-activated chloride channel family protein
MSLACTGGGVAVHRPSPSSPSWSCRPGRRLLWQPGAGSGGGSTPASLILAAAPARSAWRRRAVRPGPGCPGLPLPRGSPSADQTNVPVAGSAVILALDVSGSMCSTDVDPTGSARPRMQSASSCAPRTRAPASGSSYFRFRPGGGGTDDRARQAVSRHRLADHRSWHDDRRRDPQVRGCHRQIDRKVAPVGDGPRSRTVQPPARPGRTREIVVLLTDGANTAGISPSTRRRSPRRAGARLPDRFGTKNPP